MMDLWDKSAEGERVASYADSKEKLQENETYASSVKTVALWVGSLKIIVFLSFYWNIYWSSHYKD